jgi:hypothetical protein
MEEAERCRSRCGVGRRSQWRRLEGGEESGRGGLPVEESGGLGQPAPAVGGGALWRASGWWAAFCERSGWVTVGAV